MHHLRCSVIVAFGGGRRAAITAVSLNIVLEKLTRGVLNVSGVDDLRYVKPRLLERIRLMWIFRNFRILPPHVLPSGQARWITMMCSNGRLSRYRTVLDRELACVIGTLVLASPTVRPAHEERRRAVRLPLRFRVRYGIGSELLTGEGCDISETGIAFRGPKLFAPGMEISVHYQLGANERDAWTRTRAVIRNVADGRIGAEFSIIHPRDRAQLRQLTAGK